MRICAIYERKRDPRDLYKKGPVGSMREMKIFVECLTIECVAHELRIGYANIQQRRVPFVLNGHYP